MHSLMNTPVNMCNCFLRIELCHQKAWQGLQTANIVELLDLLALEIGELYFSNFGTFSFINPPINVYTCFPRIELCLQKAWQGRGAHRGTEAGG